MSAPAKFIHHYYSIACSKCARVLRSHLRHTSVSHVVDTGTRERCRWELWAEREEEPDTPAIYLGL
jgi:hypothetical protein